MLSKLLDVNEILKDEGKYIDILTSLEKKFMENFDNRKETIDISINGNTYKDISKSNFYTQLLLYYPFMKLKHYEFGSEFIILDKIKNFDSNTVIDYMNDLLIELLEEDKNIVNKCIQFVIDKMNEISSYFTIFHGITINLFDIIKLSKKNKRFNELIRYKIKDNIQFKEIDEGINKAFKEVEDIIKENKDCCYSPYLNAKTGINTKQLREVLLSVGNKSDLDGTLLPIPINSNFLFGLNNPLEFFFLCKSSRKAVVNNYTKVTTSGYLSRKLNLLNMDTLIDNECEDCHTDEYLPVYLDSEKTLNRFDLRYFLNNEGRLELFRSNTHKHLLNTTVKFRSPITCKGDKICKTCYGKLSNINYDIHIGIIAVLYFTSQITQGLLSTKHLSQSNVDPMDLPKEFNDFFVVDKSNVHFKDNAIGYYLSFDIESIDYNDRNEPYVNNFYIVDKKNGREIEVIVKNDLYISYELRNSLPNIEAEEDSRIYIKIDESMDYPIFTFTIENNEMTKPLNDIIHLIEKDDHLDIDNIIDINTKMLELLNKANIKLNSVHAELILRNLITDINDPTKIAKTIKDGEYILGKVSSSIINSASPILGLTFEKQRVQLEDPLIYTKEGKSLIDSIFI